MILLGKACVFTFILKLLHGACAETKCVKFYTRDWVKKLAICLLSIYTWDWKGLLLVIKEAIRPCRDFPIQTRTFTCPESWVSWCPHRAGQEEFQDERGTKAQGPSSRCSPLSTRLKYPTLAITAQEAVVRTSGGAHLLSCPFESWSRLHGLPSLLWKT